MDTLDYRQLPGQHSIFLYYLYDYDKVRDFYSGPPLSSSTVERRVETVHRQRRFSRKILVSSLRQQNQELGTSPRARESLDKLSASDTLAVLTGQQTGLFGGPALAVYKAATAVRLAQWLEGLGHPAVPVFWLASDDSDFEEVRTAHFIDRLGRPIPITYPEYPERAGQMAGTVALDTVEPCLQKFEAEVQHLDTGFVESVTASLRHAYSTRHTFRTAFGLWLSHLFRDYGLLVFDPLSPIHRTHLAEFFLTVVEQRVDLVSALQSVGSKLRSRGFLPQVKVDLNETLSFYVDGTQRHKIRFENGYFQARGPARLRLGPKEMAELVSREPERFGTNALLRPILQDYLFPTAAYVGGPAEVAYYSQVGSISHSWGIQPSIYPRASFTLLDRTSERLLKRYRLSIAEVLTDSRLGLAERIVREAEFHAVLERIDLIKSQVVEGMGTLRDEISQVDLPLAEMVVNARRKMLYQIEKTGSRFVLNRQERSPHMKRHLEHLRNRLLPGKKLQERVINFNQFLAEEGDGLIHRLVENIEPGRFVHSVMRFTR